ncbi:DNA mismatch repair protein MSH6-like [Silene latifolia]|uniref:DNA mismatch repair protein MSH6-like n=1 Tax=Silene latifolia TaxID=37657 RepID=UPI003D772122
MDTDALERFGIREEKKLPFLGKDRRDAKRRLPSDPHYDPKTLYLPLQFLKSLTSGQRQWWEFKSKHMDKVMFFKMGKFYELFEMDAHVGVKDLDLQYMKSYRVLVVEQTETSDQLEIRNKKEVCTSERACRIRVAWVRLLLLFTLTPPRPGFGEGVASFERKADQMAFCVPIVDVSVV